MIYEISLVIYFIKLALIFRETFVEYVIKMIDYFVLKRIEVLSTQIYTYVNPNDI